MTLHRADGSLLAGEAMLREVTIKNFRAFRDEQTLELRPLTMLFGENNAGKSTLLRVLPFIADSLTGRHSDPLNLSSPCFPDVSFRELLFQEGSNPIIDLTLAFDEAKVHWAVRSVPPLGERVFRYDVERVGGERFATELADDGQSYIGSDGRALPLQFTGLFADPAGDTTRQAYDVHPRDLLRFPPRVQWLRATRARFLRSARPSKAPLGPSGEGADKLVLASQELLERVQAAYRSVLGLHLSARDAGTEKQLVMSSDTAPFRVPLCDTGEGVSHLLPVFAAIGNAHTPAGPGIVCIEQPEIQLHPTAQAALGTWLARGADASGAPTLLIETHAENLLLSVLLSVVRGELDPKNLVVYWVGQRRDGASFAKRIVYDRLARPMGDWPPHAFTSDNRLAMELVHARVGRSS